MDRRSSIKSLLIGTVAGGAAITGCSSERPKLPPGVQPSVVTEPYGRTEEEKLIDQKLFSEHFFNQHELETLNVLCDMILPGTEGYHSAGEAGVTDFIAFMAKDKPDLQLPLRGGIMWIDNFSNESFNKEFAKLSEKQRKLILDQIAFPEVVAPELSQGAAFFSLVRNLTLTGYYTSKLGLEELGYKGNTPNVWDGVPDEVLAEHGLSYDPDWIAKCIDQQTRETVAQWDGNGNLIT